jgi:hypothetical protein
VKQYEIEDFNMRLTRHVTFRFYRWGSPKITHVKDTFCEFLCFDCVLVMTPRLPDWKSIHTFGFRYRYPIRTLISTLEVFVSLDKMRIAFQGCYLFVTLALYMNNPRIMVISQSRIKTKIKIALSQPPWL